jgi:hypothetical protein
LFQDKHTSSSPLYFMIASEAGKTYDVRLHLGDTVASEMDISVNGSTIQRFATAAGQYISPVIRTQANDQQIEIYFSGASIKEWAVNGIEVLEVTGSRTVLTLAASNGMIAGTSTAIQRNQTSSGQLLVPGVYWLTSDIGTLMNTAGQRINQLVIGSNGLIDLTIRNAMPGTGTVRLDSASGALQYDLTVSFVLNPVRLYDFDHVNRGAFSPLAPGYLRVLPTDVYSQITGFGWNAAVKSVDRGTTARNMPTPTELNRDKHFNSTPGTFMVMSDAGKSYSVTIHFGDTEARDVEVSFNGGTTYERVTTAANVYTNRTWNIVANSDRIQIIFRKATGTNWSVNSIEFREQQSTVTSSSASSRVLAGSADMALGKQTEGLHPIAVQDLAATPLNQSVRINVLSNDQVYFGGLSSSTIEIIEQPANGSVKVLPDGGVEFHPQTGFAGQVAFAYQVRDEFGMTSNYGQVLVNVTERLHQNFVNPLDVNADSNVSPLDVLVLIDRFNRTANGLVTSQAFGQDSSWFDVNGNQQLDPLDVLQVIDYLNKTATSPSSPSLLPEGESRSSVDGLSGSVAEYPAVIGPKTQGSQGLVINGGLDDNPTYYYLTPMNTSSASNQSNSGSIESMWVRGGLDSEGLKPPLESVGD